MISRSWFATPRVWLGLVVVTAIAAAAVPRLGAPHGLRATYFAGPDWLPGPGTTTAIDPLPTTAALKRRRPDFSERPFSVEWRGFLLVPADATYVFALTSDDGSSLSIGDTLIVDNLGRHGPTEARGRATLTAGAHPVTIRYFQDQGDLTFVARWAREGQLLAVIPAGALAYEPLSPVRRVTAQMGRALVWMLGIVWLGCLAGAIATPLGRWIARWQLHDPALVAVLTLSAVLNVWGIWWALPNTRGWAPDELVPADVLDGAAVWFSGGWHGKYPPLHYAVLVVAYAPALVWSLFSEQSLREPGPYLVLFLIGRGLGVLFSLGSVTMIFMAGRELFGRPGGAFAALTSALMAPFVYYGKLTNLEAPYLFWFAASLWAYIRILKDHARGDYLRFAVAAALAVCTKDQAYGLYVLTPIAILVSRKRWGLPLVDRTTTSAFAAAVVTFVIAGNLLFNFGGFLQHVQVITGPASSSYRMFDATLRGQLAMAAQVVAEMPLIFGWPLAAVSLVALAWGLARWPGEPRLGWLLVPVAGYYVSFLGVVLYFYDRFLLPIGFVLALFTGGWLAQMVRRPGTGRSLRRGVVAAVFAYSVMYAASVDATLASDSRIRVSRWLRDRAKPGDSVAARGPLEYFLLAEGFAATSVESVEHVAAQRPSFIVLNPWHLSHLPPGDRSREMREHLLDPTSGYRLALRYQTPPVRLPGRHPDLGSVPRDPELSSLGQLNPVLEVFARDTPAPTP